MYKAEVTLNNQAGLHARPAAMFVQEAQKYKSTVSIEKDNKVYNAKSLLGILSIGAAKGTKIRLMAEGDDEKEVIEALKALVDSDFCE